MFFAALCLLAFASLTACTASAPPPAPVTASNADGVLLNSSNLGLLKAGSRVQAVGKFYPYAGNKMMRPPVENGGIMYLREQRSNGAFVVSLPDGRTGYAQPFRFKGHLLLN